MTDFINENPMPIKLSKLERKAIHDKKMQEKLDARNEAKMNYMFGFNELETHSGKLVKPFTKYYYFDHKTLEPNPDSVRRTIFEEDFPAEFQKTSYPDIFNNTYWIGVDDDNNAKSNPTLKIFHKDHPEMVRSIRINIWESPVVDDYFLHLEIRPNRIYLNDYDGFKIFDFELNLLFFKPVRENGDIYNFKINSDVSNMAWIWTFRQQHEIDDSLPPWDYDADEKPIYDIVKYESIIEIIHV